LDSVRVKDAAVTTGLATYTTPRLIAMVSNAEHRSARRL
jgi:hypothetical protein